MIELDQTTYATEVRYCVRRVRAMETEKLGIREFRENLAGYLEAIGTLKRNLGYAEREMQSLSRNVESDIHEHMYLFGTKSYLYE